MEENVEILKASKKDINYENWANVISYYRYYIDRFAEDILGVTLFPFQKLILRAMGRFQFSMLICCRGLGKSWIVALFMICMAILYPGMNLGIVSGQGIQARMVITQKIIDDFMKKSVISNEIKDVKTQKDDCYVEFKNGSKIRAIVLGQGNNKDGARGWRFNVILVDEARLVSKSVVDTILEPMTKTKRQNVMDLQKKTGYSIDENGKMIFISSAYLKTCDLYQNFLFYNQNMISGNPNYFVCSLDYNVGIEAGLFSEEDMLNTKNKTNLDEWEYEYGATFVGSSNDSYYPYEMTMKSRVIEAPELEQPKKTTAKYVITHDVAVSGAKDSDNACTHVIKLELNPNGTYTKKIVYSRVMNGATLREQRDFLRELAHIRFPNTIKIVIDAQSAGQGLLSLFYEPWEYRNEKGVVIEFPPLVADDDDEGKRMPKSIPMIRGIMAYSGFNNEFYPYMKSCFEDGSLRLTKPSTETEERYREEQFILENEDDKKKSIERQLVHIEHDNLISELSNIKQEFSDSSFDKFTYTRIVKKKKRDRATSLMYGLSYVYELEFESKSNLGKRDENLTDLLNCVAY